MEIIIYIWNPPFDMERAPWGLHIWKLFFSHGNYYLHMEPTFLHGAGALGIAHMEIILFTQDVIIYTWKLLITVTWVSRGHSYCDSDRPSSPAVAVGNCGEVALKPTYICM